MSTRPNDGARTFAGPDRRRVRRRLTPGRDDFVHDCLRDIARAGRDGVESAAIVVHQHPGAAPAQRQGRRAADPASGARDDRHLAFEIQHPLLLTCCADGN
jgi:hypothetical protein